MRSIPFRRLRHRSCGPRWRQGSDFAARRGSDRSRRVGQGRWPQGEVHAHPRRRSGGADRFEQAASREWQGSATTGHARPRRQLQSVWPARSKVNITAFISVTLKPLRVSPVFACLPVEHRVDSVRSQGAGKMQRPRNQGSPAEMGFIPEGRRFTYCPRHCWSLVDVHRVEGRRRRQVVTRGDLGPRARRHQRTRRRRR
jgi:hypothetical protein